GPTPPPGPGWRPAPPCGPAGRPTTLRSRYQRALDHLTTGDSPRLEQWADQGEVVVQRFGGDQVTPLWQSTLDQPAELPVDLTDWQPDPWEQPTSLSFLFAQERSRVIGNVPAASSDAANSAANSERTNDAARPSTADPNPLRNTPLLLFTDGQHNFGPSPLELLSQWPSESAPVFVVGLGSTSPPEKITLLELDVPKDVYRTDRVQGTIQLQDGLKPGARFTLQIHSEDHLLWSEDFTATGTGLRSQDVNFSVAEIVEKLEATLPSDQTVARINLPLTAKVVGGDAANNSAARDNSLDPSDRNTNSADADVLTSVIGVTARKQRVLLLDSRSRWETRYVRNMLERDPQWELDAYLLRPGQAPQWFSNLPLGRPFPTKFEDFERYDLFVCGELEPGVLTNEQQSYLLRAVENGAGWIVSDGQRQSWRDSTFAPLRELLPINWVSDAQLNPSRPSAVTPTAEGDRLGMLSLENDGDTASADAWRKLPPLQLFVPTKPLPGSQVLANVEHEGTTWPLFVTRTYGAGRVFYAASDETWRWRYEVADVVHQRIWNQVCRWSMREPFAIENEYLALDSGDVRYDQGQEILLRARVKDSQGQPATLASIEALAILDGSTVATLTMDQQSDYPGVYRGRLSGLPPGNYEVQLAIPGYSLEMTQLKTKFRIEAPPNPEGLQVTRNDALLTEIANATGGMYVPEERIEELWQALDLRYNSRVVESDQQLWQSFWWFVPILVLVSFEWWLRKKVGLI
ncbi:MAG: carboxypeptidase regulatory-like domain-containing protein, partial [Planctomycetaceae bacterium]|nr:carboxypeptidase regulatory-like domain-containing protein [Planctomycetaceae bacterium]